jgi:ATP-dependent DNA helicase DinG
MNAPPAISLALTPLTVADKFKEVMEQKPGCWIFTSATLSVNDDLHHFTARLGLKMPSRCYCRSI